MQNMFFGDHSPKRTVQKNACGSVDSSLQLRGLANTLQSKIFSLLTRNKKIKIILGISTKEEDYLVGAIALHDETALLRPVFYVPRICKVFHGDQNDVTWLQRDFHIYLANLFDTYTVCLVLEKPQKSLKGLLRTIFKVNTDK